MSRDFGFWFPDGGLFLGGLFSAAPLDFCLFVRRVGRASHFGHRLPAWFYEIRCAWLAYIGRHSLIIYLAHQPVILGVMLVIADRLTI